MSFAGSRSPYHERSRPGMSPATPKRSFAANVAASRGQRGPEAVAARSHTNPLFNQVSPTDSPGRRRTQLDVRDSGTPSKALEDHKENRSLDRHDRPRDPDISFYGKGKGGSVVKTLKPFLAPIPPTSSSKASLTSPKQKVLAERHALSNAPPTPEGSKKEELSMEQRTQESPVVQVSITELQKRIKKFLQDDIIPPASQGTELPEVLSVKKALPSKGEKSPYHPVHAPFSPRPQFLRVNNSEPVESFAGAIEVDAPLGTIVGEELPPYDPKNNFLSPRPQFLRYRPHRRLVLLNKSLTDSPDPTREEESVDGELESEKAAPSRDAVQLESTEVVAGRINAVSGPVPSQSPLTKVDNAEKSTLATFTDEGLDHRGLGGSNLKPAVPVETNVLKEEVLTIPREGEAAANVMAAMDRCNLDFSVGLEGEENDETEFEEDVPTSVGERFVRGILFGILLACVAATILLASGSPGLLPRCLHGNALAATWHNSSFRTPVLRFTEGIDGLWRASEDLSPHPVVDLSVLSEVASRHLKAVHRRLRELSVRELCEMNFRPVATKFDELRVSAQGYINRYPSLNGATEQGCISHLNQSIHVLDMSHLQVTDRFVDVAGPGRMKFPDTSVPQYERINKEEILLDDVEEWDWVADYDLVQGVEYPQTTIKTGSDEVNSLLAELFEAALHPVEVKMAEALAETLPSAEISEREIHYVHEGAAPLVFMADTSFSSLQAVTEPDTHSNVMVSREGSFHSLSEVVEEGGKEKVIEEEALSYSDTAMSLPPREEGGVADAPFGEVLPAADFSLEKGQLTSEGLGLPAEEGASNNHVGLPDDKLTIDWDLRANELFVRAAVGIDDLPIAAHTTSQGSPAKDVEGAEEFAVEGVLMQHEIEHGRVLSSSDFQEGVSVMPSFPEGLPRLRVLGSHAVVVAFGSLLVAVVMAVPFLMKRYKAPWVGRRRSRRGAANKKAVKVIDSNTDIPSAPQPSVPDVSGPTVSSVNHTPAAANKGETPTISSPAHSVATPSKLNESDSLTAFRVTKPAEPAMSAPIVYHSPISHRKEMPSISAPTGRYNQPSYRSEMLSFRTPLSTYTPTVSYAPTESSMSTTGSVNDTMSVAESELSMLPEDSQLGSFTTYEPIVVNEGAGLEQVKLTPVRRSSRIRSQVASPLPVQYAFS